MGGRRFLLGIEPVMPDDDNDLLTARTTLQTGYVRLLLTCRSCLRSGDADLQGLIDGGRGDVPLTQLKFRWSYCGHREVEALIQHETAIRMNERLILGQQIDRPSYIAFKCRPVSSRQVTGPFQSTQSSRAPAWGSFSA